MLERSAIRVENDKWIKRHVVESIYCVNIKMKMNMQICADVGKYVLTMAHDTYNQYPTDTLFIQW